MARSAEAGNRAALMGNRTSAAQTMSGWPTIADEAFAGLPASSCLPPSRTQRPTRSRCWCSTWWRSGVRAGAVLTTRSRRTVTSRGGAGAGAHGRVAPGPDDQRQCDRALRRHARFLVRGAASRSGDCSDPANPDCPKGREASVTRRSESQLQRAKGSSDGHHFCSRTERKPAASATGLLLWNLRREVARI
jgi:hypothetical protein